MKRFLCIITIAAMLLCLLSGCTSQRIKGSEVTTKKNPTVRTDIRYASAYDIVSLDPHSAVDVYSHEILNMIYERLLSLDENGKIAAGLAEHWEVSSYSEYIFHLRKDVKFHNGEELTAHDVVFSLKLARQSPSSSTALEGIESIQAIDKYTVRITTDGPYAPLLRNLTSSGIPILCKKYVEENEDYTEKPVGTGPMVFKEYMPNYRVILERFDGYWGTPAIASSLTRVVIPESSSRTIALETGEIDYIDSLPPSDIARVKENPALKTTETVSSNIAYIGFNMQKEPFSDIRVRQALHFATDKQKIISTVYSGYGTECKTVFPTTMQGCNDDLDLYPYDMQLAQKMLIASGFPNGFDMEIALSSIDRQSIAEILQFDYGQLGVNITINKMELSSFLQYLKEGDFDAYMMSYSGMINHDRVVTTYFHSEGGNYMHYHNITVDQLIEKARRTIEWEGREPIYKEIQRQVMIDSVWIPLLQQTHVAGMTKNMHYDPAVSRGFYDMYISEEDRG